MGAGDRYRKGDKVKVLEPAYEKATGIIEKSFQSAIFPGEKIYEVRVGNTWIVRYGTELEGKV